MADIAASTVAQAAFRLMEMSPLSSFADGSEEAEAIRQEYPVALAGLLERADWSFASTLATPPALTGGPEALDPDLTHAYALPEGRARLLVLRQVWPEDAIWRIDADALRSDTTFLRIRYTALIEDETRMPGLFKTALSTVLAARLAPRWTTSANRAQILGEAAEAAFGLAARSDRLTASASRWDGRARGCDWVAEALR